MPAKFKFGDLVRGPRPCLLGRVIDATHSAMGEDREDPTDYSRYTIRVLYPLDIPDRLAWAEELAPATVDDVKHVQSKVKAWQRHLATHARRIQYYAKKLQEETSK